MTAYLCSQCRTYLEEQDKLHPEDRSPWYTAMTKIKCLYCKDAEPQNPLICCTFCATKFGRCQLCIAEVAND